MKKNIRRIWGRILPAALGLLALLALALPAAVAAGPAADGVPETAPLELWIHPYLPAPELVKRFTPLARHLATVCGRPVEVKVSRSYKAHLERVGEDRADLAFIGPFSYVEVTERYGPKRLLATVENNGKTAFHGIIAVRQASPLRTLSDLAGRSFAFGDQESTMGTLVPRFLLAEAGITLDRLGRYNFLGSHHDVALGVLGGFYEAGGLKEEVFQEYAGRGLRILAKSPPIPEHLFLAGRRLPEAQAAKVRRALLELKEPAILTAIQATATGFAPVRDEDYDILRRIHQTLGPLEQ